MGTSKARDQAGRRLEPVSSVGIQHRNIEAEVGIVLSHAVQDCGFRENWAAISRDLGHAFHAIVGSHFADAGRLADGLAGR